MNVGQWIVILLSALMGGWYLIGAIINRKRGMATFSWMRAGLEKLGKLSEARWIGSSGSGARLVVGQAASPFQRVEVVFLLESREILPLWIFNHVRGKRDEMIIKANLRSAPSQELEAALSGARDFRSIIASQQKKPFELLPAPQGFALARRGPQDDQGLARLNDFLGHYTGAVWRISLQRKAPHLILRANLPSLQEKPAEVFFEEVRQLVK
jgi:hypothetical protein